MMIKRILSWLGIAILSWCLIACSNDTIESVQAFEDESKPPIPGTEKIMEVSPPSLITKLNQTFAQTKPQVQIISPTPNEIVKSQNIKVKLEVTGLDLFKNPQLQMGPHLHFFLDDQPYQAVYDPKKPIKLSDLTPGTHTIRVFASRPWHESFKNRGAYAKTTFHVFTVTEENNPSDKQPLLTYSRPQGVYGAEPIMLDFYLTDAPLHVVAQESPDDDIADWRIRVTVNGESFLLDQWRPIYLQGFEEGQNWVKLEFIDENGDLIKNVFNSTVRAITYDPQLDDTLAKLVKGKISFETAQGIIDSNYKIQPEIINKKEITPPPLPSESVEQIEIEEEIISQPEEIEPKPEKIIEEQTTEVEEEIVFPELEESTVSEENLPEEEPSEVEQLPVNSQLETTPTEIMENQEPELPITQLEEENKVEPSLSEERIQSVLPDESLDVESEN